MVCGRQRVHPGARRSRVRLAFLGVRACDLAAIATLARVLGGGAHTDTGFTRRRAGLFVIAAGCTEPGGVCFCASMGTGPEPGPGYDLSLTERIDEDGHRFLVDVGTPEGSRVLAMVGTRPAAGDETAEARDAVQAAAGRMGRQMPDTDLAALLRGSRESPRWDEVADRCLTCGNCTMVCPTCFCTTTEDTTRPGRRWDRGAVAALGVLLRARLLLPARRQRAGLGRQPLPAVDDAQAEQLARPVRQLRLRRLRPLHRLVPGRHRHHRGSGQAGPGPGLPTPEQAAIRGGPR